MNTIVVVVLKTMYNFIITPDEFWPGAGFHCVSAPDSLTWSQTCSAKIMASMPVDG